MYAYAEQKHEIFTDAGQRVFIAIRDHTHRLLKLAGAARSQEMMNAPNSPCSDSWVMLACIDRMVELGELREIEQGKVAGQHRVFVAAKIL